MSKHTPLHDAHVEAGGKMVDFAGWLMPLHYGSQISEHHMVRESAGMFDVSHMTVVDVNGGGAREFLGRLVANDVGKLDVDTALYGVLLNDAGGVIDDLIVYRRQEGYRAVINASTRGKVLDWFAAHAFGQVQVTEQNLAMIAVQGPGAVGKFESVTHLEAVSRLAPFGFLEHENWMVARTGYTGEDGVEVTLPGADARTLWERLLDAGVKPAGLGARDTLRLEAGLNLSGQDMDEATSPLISNLAWTIAWMPGDRDFIGRNALETERAEGIEQKLSGLVMQEKGVLRRGQLVATDFGEGLITSGIFSPTLGYSIALARLPKKATGACQVEIRGKWLPVRIVKPPFVRRGQPVFE